MNEERPRAATYATDQQGIHVDRPQLEQLIQQAAASPRPFDVLIVYRMDVLGTPEDAHNVVARLAEFGVAVTTTQPMPRTIPEDHLRRWIQRQPSPNREQTLVRNILANPGTQRVVVDRMTAVRLYEHIQPVPDAARATLSWPFDAPPHNPLYIEYSQPIILNPEDPANPGATELLHGLVVLPGPSPRETWTIHTQASRLRLSRFSLDLQTGMGNTISDHGDPPLPEADRAVGQALTALATCLSQPDANIVPLGPAGPYHSQWHAFLPPPEQRYPEPAAIR